MRLSHCGDYPRDWRAISRRVRAEAGDRCIRCGHPAGDRMHRVVPQGEMLWEDPGRYDFVLMPCDERCSHEQDGKLRILTVHHLDGNKANCAWWNLMALCQVCHLVIQAKLVPERPYLWEHTEWAKPYIAGFYAKYYGEREITREEATGTPEKWLALGQPWLYEASA